MLSSNSSQPLRLQLYKEVDSYYESYQEWFTYMGYTLNKGEGYYYLTSNSRSIADFADFATSHDFWIDIVDFLKAFDSDFAVGKPFLKSTMTDLVNQDPELEAKIVSIPNLFTASTNEEKVAKMLEYLCNRSFLELIDKQTQKYLPTAAFAYMTDFINLINITEQDYE